jgi:hypothetical protein
MTRTPQKYMTNLTRATPRNASRIRTPRPRRIFRPTTIPLRIIRHAPAVVEIAVETVVEIVVEAAVIVAVAGAGAAVADVIAVDARRAHP